MRIEFGFQSNCSELVTHLGIVDKNEVINALKIISEVTGRTWGIDIGHEIFIPIPFEQMDELISFDYELGVHPQSILNYLKNELDEKAINALEKVSKSKWPIRRLRLYKGPSDRILYDDSIYPISANINCNDCGKKGLRVWFNDAIIEEMPAFDAIRRNFNSDFQAHDGGSPYNYLEWMAFHYIDKDKTKEIIMKGIEWKNFSDIPKDTIVIYEANPPLYKNQNPDKNEIQEINRRVFNE